KDRVLPAHVPLSLSTYSIHPLIIITVDCFTADEPNRKIVRSAFSNLFAQNNLIPGFGVLFFELRGWDTTSLEAQISQLQIVLSTLFAHASSWRNAPVVVFFNLHFDGFHHFQLGKPEVIDA